MFCDHCGADNIDTASTCFACQHPLNVSSQALATGTARELLASNTMLKGRYRILQCIGQGGFGSVYKAEDTQEHRYVAVKEINLSQLKPQEIIEATDAFNREVSALSQLRHPNLPNMYDHFTDPDHWYLIIDFIEGETLEDYLEQVARGMSGSRGIQMPDVLEIGIQLCTVLDYMHKHTPPIIFRDLKPSNIMLTPTQSGRRIYLIDFGIARQFKPGQARDTIAFGSPGYAAPEQYGKAQTTPRSDIYSLGAILHQMLTGKDPAESPFHFAPIRSYHSSLPPQLDALIMQMVDMEPHKRPTSMLRVKEELEHLLKHLAHNTTLSAKGYISGYQAAPSSYGSTGTTPLPGQLPYLPYPPSPASYQPMPSASGGQQQTFYQPTNQAQQGQAQTTYYTPSTKQPAKPKKGTTRRAVLITAGVMGAAWLLSNQIFQNQANSSSPVSATPVAAPQDGSGSLANLTYQNEFTGHTAPINALVWSHLNDNFVASASNDKTIQFWDPENALASSPVICRGHTQAVTCIDCTPDNSKLASGSLDKTVRLWDLSGNQKAVATFPNAIHSVSWKPDITSLAVACADGKVYLCNPDTLHILATYNRHTKSVRAVAWSPNGNYIASGGEDNIIRVWTDTSGLPDFTTYYGHSSAINALAWSPDNQYIASGSSDRTVQVWRPLTSETITLYLGHMTGGTPPPNVDMSKSAPSEVYAVAWQPSGKFVASAGRNGILHIWDPTSGRPAIIKPDASGTGINALAWSPDSSLIVSAGADANATVNDFSF